MSDTPEIAALLGRQRREAQALQRRGLTFGFLHLHSKLWPCSLYSEDELVAIRDRYDGPEHAPYHGVIGLSGDLWTNPFWECGHEHGRYDEALGCASDAYDALMAATSELPEFYVWSPRLDGSGPWVVLRSADDHPASPAFAHKARALTECDRLNRAGLQT